MTRASLLIVLVLAASATAQPADVVQEELPEEKFDPATCIDQPPTPQPLATGTVAPPVTWGGFEIVGTLTDKPTTVRALFEPTMNRHRALTDSAREDIRRISNAYGYHLVALRTREVAGAGTTAVLHLAPLPIARTIDVDVKQSFFGTLLDDEIRRRMRVRIGGYLPWSPQDRACVMYEEKQRIEEFLRDEGYFDGRVTISQRLQGAGISLTIKVRLGGEYKTGVINIEPREPDGISDTVIRNFFRHSATCIISSLCYGTARFKRSQHQTDIQKVIELFHKGGFPAVRVRTDFDPLTSFDRRTRKVNFTITIDPRRKLDVVFEGQDESIKIQELLEQLTFNQAASSDDVEANDSAQAITAFLQSRGFFDARVTWNRERFERFDRIVFRIDQGKSRQIRSIELAGNYALDDDRLLDAIGTREVGLSSSLFGKRTAATSAQLAADVDLLVELYRRTGYREARVRVNAATSPRALDSAALAGALIAAERGDGIYVRYTIREGQPTLLTQIQVELGEKGDALTTQDQRDLCQIVLADLAAFYEEPQLAQAADPNRCIALAANLKFRETDALETRDRLKDRLYSLGRPRAEVVYEPRVLGPHRIAAHYKLTDVQPLKIGKVVIRGNFRTRSSIILGELQFHEGQPLTKDVLADGARRLRTTGLFDAVNVAMPDLENTSEGSVNAIVEVSERFDYGAQLDAEVGISSYNGTFLRLVPSFKNLMGRGISLDLAGTIGFDAGEYIRDQNLKLRQLGAEVTLRFPYWLWRDYVPLIGDAEFRTEITAFHRRQDTPRFGVITTDGVTLALSRTWQRPRTETAPARAITVGPYYDFRLRERPVDVLRPAGADDSETQVPISTRTGSIGMTFEWEQRVDRAGGLSPLAPEDGFRLESQVSIASPYLGGQDTFLKVSAAGSKYWPLGSNLVLRADLRYDQGFPLGGAVLLPEVERFFAGGDSTVRGYEDDRLATEIIQVAVPPLDNVSQLRILPAGGNIRVMSSIDVQVRIWKVVAAGAFVDAGMITNQWSTVHEDDIRPSVGVALIRLVTPFGTGALERAMPLRPHLGDNPRGRWHLSFAARAQF